MSLNLSFDSNEKNLHYFGNKLHYKYLMSFSSSYFIPSHILMLLLLRLIYFPSLLCAVLKINFHFSSLHIFIHFFPFSLYDMEIMLCSMMRKYTEVKEEATDLIYLDRFEEIQWKSFLLLSVFCLIIIFSLVVVAGE